MIKRILFLTGAIGAMLLTASMSWADSNKGSDDQSYCMDVVIEPFHMMPGYMDTLGACAVRDYWGGELQKTLYPFTKEEHLFNCDYYEDVPPHYGAVAPLPTGDLVPSSVVSEDMIEGTIGGHAFSARLYCASLTNWYQDSCADPNDPETCAFQLAQPFLNLVDRNLYPRVTEVSVLDGVIAVEKRNKTVEIPLVMATRAAGITHIESMDPPQVGASVTHSSLGMLTYKENGKVKALDGSLDLLLQGHIFHPRSVEEDPGAAVIKGSICSKDLYKLLNKKGKKGGKGRPGKDD